MDSPYNFSDGCQDSAELLAFIITTYSIETILGVLGNLCLIFVTTRQKEKSNVTNLLIANLAFSDFLRHTLWGSGPCQDTW